MPGIFCDELPTKYATRSPHRRSSCRQVAALRAAHSKVCAPPHSGISPGHYSQMLGLYEKPLVPAIEAAIARQPGVIVDVGSHWGYYALGLAMCCPQSRVVAYEMDHFRAALLRKYGRLNDVEKRLEVRGACTIESLAADLAGLTEPFLFMDVEAPRTFCWIRCGCLD